MVLSYRSNFRRERQLELFTELFLEELSIDAVSYTHLEAKHLEYADSRYANQNPCTTIYQLVRQLLGRDEKLNAEMCIRDRIRTRILSRILPRRTISSGSTLVLNFP